MARERDKPGEPLRGHAAEPGRPATPDKPLVSQLEGPGLHPDQERERQRAQTEQEPKPAKLTPATDELGKPEDRPPVPPVADREPVPRFVHQNFRAPEGLQRYTVRCDEPFGVQPKRYVLVRKGDRQGAIDHYMRATGLQAVLDTFPDDDKRPRPRMVCNELPD